MAIGTVGVIIAGIGSAAGAALSYASANAQASAAKQNARTQEEIRQRNLRLIETEKAFTIAQFNRDRKRRMSALRAASAASGVTFEGSPLDLFADNAAQNARDQFQLDLDFANRMETANIEGLAAVRRERLQANESAFRQINAGGSFLSSIGGTVYNYSQL